MNTVGMPRGKQATRSGEPSPALLWFARGVLAAMFLVTVVWLNVSILRAMGFGK